MYLKFNSKKSSTRDLANEILHPFRHLSSEKKDLNKYDITGSYIALLAKFGNYCSIVWAYRQAQWKDKNFGILFLEEAAKKLRVVLQCIFECDFLSPCIYYNIYGIENSPSASMSCCSDDLAQWLPCLDL